MTDEIYPVDPDTGDKNDVAAFDLNGNEIGSGSVEGYFRVVDADGELTGDAVELPDGTVIPSGATPAVDLTPRDDDGDTLNDQGVTVNGTLYGNATGDDGSGGGSGGSVSLSVATDSTAGVQTDSVDVTGDLTELSGTDAADVYIEYRQTGASTWQSTSKVSQSSTGTFTHTPSGLSHGTGYEVRAVAESGGTTATGSTLTVTTADLIEDAERTSLDHYVGDNSDWSIVTSHVVHGDKALEGVAPSGGKTEIESDSGLPNYPDGSEPYRVHVEWSTSNARLFIYYEVVDSNNRYRLDISNGRVRLMAFDGGASSQIALDDAPGLNENTEYELEIDYTPGGTHTITVNDEQGTQQTQISGSSTVNHSANSIRWGVNDTGSGGATGWFEYGRQGGDRLRDGGGGTGN